MTKSLRVLVVDDSPFVRELLTRGLNGQTGLEVIGSAGDGSTAEKMAKQLQPDVITMDLVMPMKGGLDTARCIMKKNPTAILIVAALKPDENEATLKTRCARYGATDVFIKPNRAFDENASNALGKAIRNAYTNYRINPISPKKRQRIDSVVGKKSRCIGIVASTAGPSLLNKILSSLPHDFDIPVMVVQHTIPGHIPRLAEWLDLSTHLRVQVAEHGQVIESGFVYLAPDDVHMEVSRIGKIRLSNGPAEVGHKPSGNIMLRSIASSFRTHCTGLILTGMGNDGALGLRQIERGGGVIIVQDPRRAAVAGMPKAAFKATHNPILADGKRLIRMLGELRSPQEVTA